MEEILKKIKAEINFIKNEKNELDLITDNCAKIQDEIKELKENQNFINDKESAFYKDIQKEIDIKEDEFRQENIKRMTKDREIENLILEKKSDILTELEENKKYIEENRNVKLDEKEEEFNKIKSERDQLEKIIKRDEINGISENDQIQANRIRKVNEMNSKLGEIETLKEIFNNKTPFEKFQEVESMIDIVNNKFNKDNLDELLNEIDVDDKEISNHENDVDDKEISNHENDVDDKEISNHENDVDDKEISNHENDVDDKNKIGDKKRNEQEEFLNKIRKEFGKIRNDMNKKEIYINPDKNRISINSIEELFYNEEKREGKKNIKIFDKNNIFYNDSKILKNIDKGLLNVISKIDEGLVQDYLNVIKGKNNDEKTFEESKKRLEDSFVIKYEFEKNRNPFSKLREKRIARYAKKIGIASLEGIDEKSLLEKITDRFSSFSVNKMLSGNKIKAIGDGKISKQKEKTNAQKQKEKTLELCQNDGFRKGLIVNKETLKRERVDLGNIENRQKDKDDLDKEI